MIKKYRNYTSLALWAGDNENGQAYGWAGRPYEFAEDPISYRILKKACETFDPNRFYLTTSPGSPCGDLKGGDNPESPYQATPISILCLRIPASVPDGITAGIIIKGFSATAPDS